MNKQGPTGIEWTTYTWNVIGGCSHGCRWKMPDGAVARCYAEAVAEGVARKAYPRGFEHHYWNPARLEEPLKEKTPARIFADSMSDMMGAQVPDEHILAVIQTMRRADWHIFQVLTKNPKRLLKFDWPKNVWVGISMPPDVMNRQVLTPNQKVRYMDVTIKTLSIMRIAGNTTFISFEPLSWDVTPFVDPAALSWAIIGAASNGATYYQPERAHLDGLITLLKGAGVPLFFKGNLHPSIPADQWREEFPLTARPAAEPSPTQLGLF